MDHRCKYKTSNSKPTEENIGENICKLELSKDYLCTIQKAQSIKEQIDKLDFFKTRNSVQKTLSRMTSHELKENSCK